jgi:hypothetical protein
MAIQKELFINALQAIEIDERFNVPTAVLFSSTGAFIGHRAYEQANDVTDVNENFKLNLGESAPGRLEPPRFETGDGKQRSAHEITKTYFEGVLRQATAWISDRGLKPAARVLVAEPLALDQGKDGVHDWLANYRSRVRSILSPIFSEVDFLPEPFAVFQYYRYGVKHPLIAERKRHAALVVDFGGGTFDVSVVDTTATGDVSGGGRNSRPLAASSIPVGGSFINFTIARELIARNLDKGMDKNKLERAWQLYRSGAEAVGGAQALAPDFRQFIRNVKRVVAQVEQAKVHIVEGIADWSIDAAYEPSPASLVSIPKNPFADKPTLVDVRFDAVQLRDTFTKRIWAPHLRATLIAAIERASADLSDRPINLVLLSGGSANIRWLSTLIEAELRERLPMAEILELHSSFQEVVSKGLAIECARKTFNGGTSDFKAVTYNRLCMVLGSDGDPPRAYRFKPVQDSVQERDQGEGTLLQSSFAIGACIDKPIRWKFRLQSPPKRFLDYYFLKSSLDFGDVTSLQNVDHRIYTPPRTDFDSSISLQLEVREDGTATPTFIYKQGRTEAETIAVKGQSFYLDMTFGKATTLGEAYVGFDFGTSNSSVSYVEQSAVRQYTQRAGEAGWRELNELIGSLPYPAANPLGKFLGATAERDQRDRFAEAFESMLCLIASVAYVDYINGKGSRQTNLFKQLRKLSAGPLWGFVRGIIEQKPKESRSKSEFQRLMTSDCEKLINLSIDAINDHKHHRTVSFVDYYRVLGLLGNTLNNALAGWRFGGFDEVKKKGFSSKRSGLFRAAHGSHSPFVEIFRYEGAEDFSDLEAVLVSRTTGEAFRLAPFVFWTPPDSRGDRTVALLDSVAEDEASYRTVEGGQSFSASQESELSALFAQCRHLSTRDEALEPVVCAGVGLVARGA